MPGPGKGARPAAHCRPEPRGACANAAPVQADHGLPSGSQMKAESRTTPGDTVAPMGMLSAFSSPDPVTFFQGV